MMIVAVGIRRFANALYGVHQGPFFVQQLELPFEPRPSPGQQGPVRSTIEEYCLLSTVVLGTAIDHVT